LILGVLLGFRTGVGSRERPAAASDPYAIGLEVKASGEALHIRWNRQAPAIRRARSGILSIQDGELQKTVELDAAQLAAGSVIYRNLSEYVRMKLEVSAGDGPVVSETREYRDTDGAPAAQNPAPK
jgi:hypothetical protein